MGRAFFYFSLSKAAIVIRRSNGGVVAKGLRRGIEDAREAIDCWAMALVNNDEKRVNEYMIEAVNHMIEATVERGLASALDPQDLKE